MSICPKEITEILADVLAPDVHSPSGLVWKSSVANRIKIHGRAGTLGKDGYWTVQIKGKKLAAHRVLWWLLNGDIPVGQCIDHIDGNRGNNKPENLRLATRCQNNQNARKRAGRVWLPKGITAIGGSYQAQIQSDRTRWRLRSKDLDSLTRTMQSARVELHGEFACHG